jgi:hypothetical protein
MRHVTRSRVLVAVALAVGAYVAFSAGDDEPVARAPKASVHAARIGADRHDVYRRGAVPTLAMLKNRVNTGTASAALFASRTWYKPPPPPPPAPVQTTRVEAPAAPTAPPLPYAFMGSFKPAGEPQVFFLTRADRVYDVHVGDVIDTVYSVDSFDGRQLQLTYKPLNIQQQLNAEGSQ